MFYNLRWNSPKAYAVMHRKGLVGLSPVAKEEAENAPLLSHRLQNAADQHNEMSPQPDSADHQRYELDLGLEFEAELLRTMEELCKQICKEHKSAMLVEKERLACKLAVMRAWQQHHGMHPNKDRLRSRPVSRAGA